MKPKSKRESYWRTFGFEYRHRFQKGSGAGKAARNFTRKQCNKSMRIFGKKEIKDRLVEYCC